MVYIFITVEGADFMNLEPKTFMEYSKIGFIILKVGKGAFTLLGRRLFRKHKKEKVQMKKYRNTKKYQKNHSAFFLARMGVCKRVKIGLRGLLIMKERYL